MRTITINNEKEVDEILNTVKERFGMTQDIFVREAIKHELIVQEELLKYKEELDKLKGF